MLLPVLELWWCNKFGVLRKLEAMPVPIQFSFCWDHSETIVVSDRPETETILVLFCFILTHKVQYDFTVQSIYSNYNVSLFMLRVLRQLHCTRSYKSTVYHVVTYEIHLCSTQSRCCVCKELEHAHPKPLQKSLSSV